MAAQSDLAREYVARAEKMKWKDLAVLWNEIKSGTVKDWDAGKALEHLVVRGFILSGLEAEYPYDVPPGGKPIEQIDGLVELESLTFLIECKDKNSVAIEAIAKLINQLLRRPQTTFGCVFTSGEFTPNALLLVRLGSAPHLVLDSNRHQCMRQEPRLSKDVEREISQPLQVRIVGSFSELRRR